MRGLLSVWLVAEVTSRGRDLGARPRPDPTPRMDFWAFSAPNGGVFENAAEWLASGFANDVAAATVLPFVCRAP